MRGLRHVLCLLGLAAALAGCGGDDDNGNAGGGQQKADKKGAETAVRDYLRALVAKDGEEACSKLSPDYQRSVLKQNQEFAEKQGADSCSELIDSVTKTSRSVTFEGEPLNANTVDRLKLVVTVRLGGQEQNATVTGAQGLQRYELVTSDGRWLITGIVNAGG